MNNQQLPRWTPFVRSGAEKMTPAQLELKAQQVAKEFGGDVDHARRTLQDILENEHIYINSRYQVSVRKTEREGGIARGGWPAMIWLSIKRLDKAPIGPERYRDFMRIKDDLISPEHEAVELYPARSRETDTANQYHVFVLVDPEVRFPFGFTDRRNVKGSGDFASGARQAPFEEHHPQ